VTRRVHLVAAAACLLLPAAANGQNAPCARPAFERVAGMEGRWRVDWSTRVAQGRMERTVAAAEITAVIPQCALLERLIGRVENRPFWAAVLLTAQDTARRVWIDSNHGEPVVFEGEWDADTLAFHWTRRIEDRELRLRHLYFAITSDSFRTATWLSPSPSQGWQLVGEASYRRERGS
jgi:hypothetical protein